MAPPQPPCEVCGNRSYSLIEGFFYCTQCHTQNQTLRETESDQVGAAIGSLIRVASQRTAGAGTGDANSKKKTAKFIENGFDMAKIRHWTMSNTDDYPQYLFQIGRRLTTFPRLVVQFAAVLHRDFDVPIEVKKISFHLVQKYFQYYGIAFNDEEVEEEDEANQSIFRFNRSIIEVRRERRVKERQRVETRNVHAKVAERSQQADIWNFLSQTQQEFENTQATQNLELQQAFDEEEVNAIIECTTKLSKRATKLAARIYLEVDLVVAFAFIAAQCAGANWISIWDIYRWFREGRLLVTPAQIRALGTAPDNNNAFTSRNKRERIVLNGTLPMSDYLQKIIYLSHILPLPPSMPITPFEQIAKRFIFNLNLPLVFLHRIYALIDLIGTPLNNIGIEFYPSVYPRDKNFVDKIHSVKELGWRKYFNHVFKHNNSLQCFISLELKVTSLIVLALKMMFGLDGQREYTMNPNSEEDDEIIQFDVHDWLIQLNLRLAVWKGTPVSKVVSSQYLYQKPVSTRFEQRLTNVDMGSIARNKLNYDRCVPVRQYNSNKDKQFYNIFADDISKFPTEYSSNEAYYTPLRFQATLNKQFRDEITDTNDKQNIDEKKEKLFFADFRDCGMDYFPNDELQYEYKINSCNHNCKDPESEAKWLKLFPCAKSYVRYPITSQMYIMRKDLSQFGFTPILDYIKFSHIFEDSQRYFHSQFSHILDNFSYILGEEPEGIFATFLLIENMLLNTKNTAILKDALINGKIIRSGFRYSKTVYHENLNKYAYWIKGSKREGSSRHFIYGRNKLPSEIREIKRLQNWENLEKFTGEEGFPTLTVDEMISQNRPEKKGNEKQQCSTSETEEPETEEPPETEEDNVIFDIERDDSEEEEEETDKESDNEMEAENSDSEMNNEDVEMEDNDEEKEEDGDASVKTQRMETQQKENNDDEESDSSSSNNDSDSDDSSTLLDDSVDKKEKKFAISSDLALTFLFWKYW
uniref:TATA box-binding protein-associated factor RNA polymerase I subunit B n=1 Tax=Panagrolaimus superbus TaxID=310955 RepID=A0A914Z4S0_9BILA